MWRDRTVRRPATRLRGFRTGNPPPSEYAPIESTLTRHPRRGKEVHREMGERKRESGQFCMQPLASTAGSANFRAFTASGPPAAARTDAHNLDAIATNPEESAVSRVVAIREWVAQDSNSVVDSTGNTGCSQPDNAESNARTVESGPADLTRLVAAWPSLPIAVRQRIMELINHGRGAERA